MRSRTLSAAILVAAGTLLAASRAHAADPTTSDCLNANEASIKLRSEHKLRAARAQLLICAAATCPGDVRDACSRQVIQINQAMPTVVFEVKAAAGQELTDVKVSMDGEPIATRLEGTAVSLDPGEHQFTFEANGQRPSTKTLVIHEGEKERHESIVLGGASEATPAAPAPAPAPTSPAPAPTASAATSQSTTAEAAPNDGGSSQRKWGLVVGGVGAAGLVAGSIFGLMASSSWGTAQKGCQTPLTNCSPQANDDRNSALTFATVSTISFIAGGVLLGGGALLCFTAPQRTDSAAPAVSLAIGPGSIGAVGSF